MNSWKNFDVVGCGFDDVVVVVWMIELLLMIFWLLLLMMQRVPVCTVATWCAGAKFVRFSSFVKSKSETQREKEMVPSLV